MFCMLHVVHVTTMIFASRPIGPAKPMPHTGKIGGGDEGGLAVTITRLIFNKRHCKNSTSIASNKNHDFHLVCH